MKIPKPEWKKVRNIGKQGTGWKIILSDGWCAYQIDLVGVHTQHSVDSLGKVLIKASKTRRKATK